MYIFKSIYMLTYVYSRNLGYSYSFAISGKRMQVFSSMRSDSMLAFLVWSPSVFFLLKNVTTTGCLIELLSQPGMITVMVVLVQHIWHVWVNDFTARDDFTKTLHVWPQSDFGVVLDHWYSFAYMFMKSGLIQQHRRMSKLNPNDMERRFLPSVWNQTESMTPQEFVLMHQCKKTCYIAIYRYIYIYMYMYKSYMSYIFLSNIIYIYHCIAATYYAIFFSGFTRSPRSARQKVLQPRPVTRKPFSRKSLWRKERKVRFVLEDIIHLGKL